MSIIREELFKVREAGYFSKPCPHERPSDYICSPTLPDYHPLTREEVIELLSTENVRDIFNWPAISIRLAQAIPGMVCPQPTDGILAARIDALEAAIAGITKTGATPKMVDAIMALIS